MCSRVRQLIDVLNKMHFQGYCFSVRITEKIDLDNTFEISVLYLILSEQMFV